MPLYSRGLQTKLMLFITDLVTALYQLYLFMADSLSLLATTMAVDVAVDPCKEGAYGRVY